MKPKNVYKSCSIYLSSIKPLVSCKSPLKRKAITSVLKLMFKQIEIYNNKCHFLRD